MARRFLALHLPDLATARIRRAEPGLGDSPLATWEASGSRRLLVAVDAAAAALGLAPGQALADAQAIAPGLLLRPADREGDARALRGLALWARRYTPLAAIDPPEGLILDITGCDHLFGGEAALLGDALDRLRHNGLAVQGAVAGAAATAAALARSRADQPIAVSGIEAALAAPLPLGPALRLDAAALEALARLGLRRVGDLLDQPRGPLARRFGKALLDGLDAVTGRRPHAIQPVQPPPELVESLDLLEPLITRPAIDAALDRLLAGLCTKLRLAGLGARRLALLAWRVDGTVQEVAIGTGQPNRDPAHLRRLFAEGLDGLQPDLGFERMALEARATDRMETGAQTSLGLGARQDRAALAELLDRLGQRARVQRVAPVASHWPERSVLALDPQAVPPPPPPGWSRPEQPLLRLRRPKPLEVVALLPDAPPASLRWRGASQRVLQAEGPLRLEPEWWRAQGRDAAGAERRDAYRVELPCGTRLLVCRGGASGWRLHGYLP
ncbi:DNA polymerase Y family protein [Falsiroseomonas sp.]|uniref:Y-family DNA polymerase n=1 Tax=Falsiroseomonas sp. TaxID=2870721 RepID=UPI00272BE049|nr:DNA polymerase Y family protein [Falsiroseomonas sp.]